MMILHLAVAWLALAAAGQSAPHDVALVVPARASHGHDQGETQTARQTAARVGRMLDELQIPCERLSEAALCDETLKTRRIIILAYSPKLSDEATRRWQISREQAASFWSATPCRRSWPRCSASTMWNMCGSGAGQFAEIRCDDAQVAGLPPSIRQDSWNITVARPAGFGARIVGRWYDDAGQPTGRAALLLSDRGALVGHILLGDDWQGKKQLLAALLGHWSPPLWRGMAQAAIEHAGAVGHCRDFQQTADAVRDQGDRTALPHLDAAVQALAAARAQFARERFVASFASANRARQELVAAYLRSQPSLPREGRAAWNHSGTGAFPGDWDRSARLLAKNGFNMILPNMLWGGLAHYPSEVLPPSDVFRHYGDQIEQCTAAASKHGLEVHVWKVYFNLAGARRSSWRSCAARVARRLPCTAGRWTGYARRTRRTGGWKWRAWWKSSASIASPVCIWITFVIRTGSVLLRRLPAAVRGRLGPPRGQLAAGLFQRPAEGGIQRLALPADHATGGGRAS